MGTLRVVHDWNHRNRGVKNGDISDEQTSDLNIHVRRILPSKVWAEMEKVVITSESFTSRRKWNLSFVWCVHHEQGALLRKKRQFHSHMMQSIINIEIVFQICLERKHG